MVQVILNTEISTQTLYRTLLLLLGDSSMYHRHPFLLTTTEYILTLGSGGQGNFLSHGSPSQRTPSTGILEQEKKENLRRLT